MMVFIDNYRKKWIIHLLLFLALYLVIFHYLENRNVSVSLIVTHLDHLIPFCEWFIIPYLFWFPFMFVVFLYFFFCCQDFLELKKLLLSFMLGMSVFLIVSFFFPNGHNLRPILIGTNFLTVLVNELYSIDTSTNVFPSMHVFCTISAYMALIRQKKISSRKLLQFVLFLITIMILLSTVFLKQHSIIDVLGALGMNMICYLLFYKFSWIGRIQYE